MKMKNFYILLICLMLKAIDTISVDYKIENLEQKSGLYVQDMGAIFIYRKSYRIISYLNLNHILNFDTKDNLPCVYENESEPSSICTMYNSIQEKVTVIQKTTLRNLGLDEDKFQLQEKNILLYGDIKTEDFTIYARIPNGDFNPYEFNDEDYYNPARLYKSGFGSTFPDKLKDLPLNFSIEPFADVSMSEISQLFHHWKCEMESLERAIFLSETGKIHPSIFTRATLVTALKYAKKSFKDLIMPFELVPLNYDDIINISNVKISIVNDKLLYDLEIPLIQPDNYRLYRLIPWPMKLTNQNAYFFVEPTEDFIAIKAHHHSYIPFKENELETCKSSKKRKFCSVPSSMIDLELPETCELSLISSNYKKNLLSVCTVKLIKFKETVWHRLHNENSWIFTTSQDSITVNCLEEPSVNVTLNNSGCIKLNSSCVATSEKVTLKPFQNHVGTSIVPQLQLFSFNVADEMEGFFKNLKGEFDDSVLYDFGKKGYLNPDELKTMGISLDGIKIKVVSGEKGSNHIWLWSFLMFLSLLFIGYILYESVWQTKIWRKGHSSLTEEFYRRRFLSKEEVIVDECL